MYNLADQTWKEKPKIMSKEVLSTTAHKIAEHAKKHGLTSVQISLHGGEPLLMGMERIQYLVRSFNRELDDKGIETFFTLQTNGTLLNKEWTEFFIKNKISIGVSLDGVQSIHDSYRVDHSGKGSYAQIIEAINNARTHPDGQHIYKATLSVINLNADPCETLEHLIALGFERMDFLFPDNNYQNFPDGKTSLQSTEYGDWLIKMFDYWFKLNNPLIKIRVFDLIIGMLLGISQGIDAIGGNPVKIAVIETDGEIEPLDVLKSTVNGLTKTGYNVLTNDIDHLEKNLYANLLMKGHENLSPTCLSCKYESVCGGGYLPHRYNINNGFNNPSVYCADLYKLINHIELKLEKLIAQVA
jgi:uncharacterized protein